MKLTYRQIAFCLISLSILTGMQKARATEGHVGIAPPNSNQSRSERAINFGKSKPALAFSLGMVSMLPGKDFETKLAQAIRAQLTAMNPGVAVGPIRFDLPPGNGVTHFTVTGSEKKPGATTPTDIVMHAQIIGDMFVAPTISGSDGIY
jgi:hypothetical protein